MWGAIKPKVDAHLEGRAVTWPPAGSSPAVVFACLHDAAGRILGLFAQLTGVRFSLEALRDAGERQGVNARETVKGHSEVAPGPFHM